MKYAGSLLLVLLAGAATAGCGPSDAYCSDVESAASQHVLDAIAGDQPCGVDEDCEVVAVNGSCFDNCSRVIATAERETFEQALDEAEADHCVDYDGCTLIVPPCAPPDDASCGADGQCQGG